MIILNLFVKIDFSDAFNIYKLIAKELMKITLVAIKWQIDFLKYKKYCYFYHFFVIIQVLIYILFPLGFYFLNIINNYNNTCFSYFLLFYIN